MFTTQNASYVNGNALEGVTYYYKLKVFFEDGTFGFTPSVTNSCKDITLEMAIIVGNRADGKPTLSWSALENVDHYEVLRCKTSTGSYSRMFSTTGTKYTNTNADEGATYFYKIKVVFKDGKIGYSPIIENKCLKPDIDLGIKITNNADGKPKFTWKAAAGAKEYIIYRSTSLNGKYSKMLTTSKTSYTNTSAVEGQTYYYKIVVVMNDGKEKFTSVFTATCIKYSIDLNVKVTNSIEGKPKLSWKAAEGVKEYVVYRATERNGKFSKMFTTKNTSYTNTSAVAGKTYYYKLVAVMNDGNEKSTPVIVAKSLTVRNIDLNVKVKYTLAGKPKLTWSKTSDVREYQVYRSTTQNGTYSKMLTTKNTSYTNTSAVKGKTYYYKIVVVKNDGSKRITSAVKATAKR